MAQATNVNYFGQNSLAHLWEKIKAQDSSLYDKLHLADSSLESEIKGIIDSSLPLKVDKVYGTEDNFVGFGANGSIKDSGKKASDFKTVQSVVADTDATTDGSTLVFVDAVTQNANGEITVHKKGVSLATPYVDGTNPGSDGLLSARDKATIDNLTTGLDEKADKVENATAGNFAGLDESGNLVDSGKKAADFKEKQVAVTDPVASDASAFAFIDTLSQNEDGVISATKKVLPVVAKSTSGVGGNNGLMTAAQAEKLEGIEADADVNIIESVKVNGTGLVVDSSDKSVNVLIAEGTANGTIKVNGVDVSVHGLGSAAYEASTAFDTSGAAAEVLGADGDASTAATVYGAKKYAQEYADTKKAEVIGKSNDASTADTIYGAKAYADAQIAAKVSAALKYKGSVADHDALKAISKKEVGDVYNVVAAWEQYPAGTNYAWNGTEWDPLGGSIDLSPYLTNTNMVEITNGYIDSICK